MAVHFCLPVSSSPTATHENKDDDATLQLYSSSLKLLAWFIKAQDAFTCHFGVFSALLQYLVSLGIQSLVQQGAMQGKVAHKLMDALKDTDILHWKHSLSELIEISLAQSTSIWRMYGKRSDGRSRM